MENQENDKALRKWINATEWEKLSFQCERTKNEIYFGNALKANTFDILQTVGGFGWNFDDFQVASTQ
tara:strand:+ start:339 stop:539 length:201 start_codon:yes stop_codon:yes gene_type:complete